jgi:3-oxoacyl-(acyl-carrier-protein) synthase
MSPIRILGAGAVTAHGIGVEALWTGVKEGRTRISPLTRFSGEGLCSTLAAEAPLLPNVAEDRASALLLTAARELRLPGPSPRRGIVVGTTKGAFDLRDRAVRDVLSMPAQKLAKATDSQGPVRTVSAACASSLSAVGEAMLWLESGRCDEVLVAGTEALHEFVYLGFHALKALSPTPARPFDKARAGLSLGEGAGVLWLATGVRQPSDLGVIEGFGASADAYDQTAPDPAGAGLELAVRRALRSAKLSGSDVQRYHAHGTGTLQNDAMETQALARASDGAPWAVSATKGSYGHTLGAAGILDVIVALSGLNEGYVPPVVGLQTPDPGSRLDVSRQLRFRAKDSRAIVGSAGFGGLNCAVVVHRGAGQ